MIPPLPPQALDAEAFQIGKDRRHGSTGRFLHNHADGIASIDLFVVPAISFRPLYGLLILLHGRRRILWLGVDGAPDGGTDCPATYRGLRLGTRAEVYHP